MGEDPSAKHDDKSARPTRVLYGRRQGKRLRPGRRALIETLLPKLSIPASVYEPGPFDPATLFDRPTKSIWLEVGFGAGEHLAWQARTHPGIGLIGAEPFLAGVARLLSEIDADGLDNIRLISDDVRPLLAALKPQSLGRLFLLFPDPWPKTRHHKRRFINAETVALVARALEDGGEWRIATDIADYARWSLAHLSRSADFHFAARNAADWRHRPADWPATRYEKKAIAAGRRPVYLSFTRKARAV